MIDLEKEQAKVKGLLQKNEVRMVNARMRRSLVTNHPYIAVDLMSRAPLFKIKDQLLFNEPDAGT